MIVLRVREGIIGHFASRAPEWLLGFTLINVGQALAGPGDTFSTSHSYDTMAAIAPEQLWGYSMMTVGILRFFVLTVNGNFAWFKPFSPFARTLLSFLSFFFWFLIAIGMLCANPIGTGARAYSSFFLCELYACYVASGDAGHAFWPWWRARKRNNGRS